MTEQPKMTVNIDGISLTEGEFVVLQSFVGSPAYGLIRKMCLQAAASAMSNLENQKEPVDIYRSQGKIASYRWLSNMPGLLVQEEIKHRQHVLNNKDKPVASRPIPPPASP